MAKQRNGNGKPASVFVDKDLNVVRTDDAIAKAYREVCVEERQEPLENLDDAQIVAIIKAISGDETDEETGPDLHSQRLDALVDANERENELQDTRSDISAMTPQMLLAERVGEEIGSIADPFLTLAADVGETATGTPLELAIKLMKEYKEWKGEFADNGYPIRCPGVMQFPVPGSSYNDADGTWGNGPLDIDQVKNELTTGKRVTRFYRTMADSMGEGPQLVSDLDDLTIMAKAPDSAKNKVLKDRYATDKESRKSKAAQLSRRRTTRASCLGKAIGFLQVITRLHDEFDTGKVDWTFVEEFSEWKEICKRNRPVQLIAIGDKAKGTKTSSTDPYSLGQFLSLQHPGPNDPTIRFQKAKEKGGTTAALNEVIKERAVPAPDSGQGGGKDSLGKDQGIPTPEGIESFFNMLTLGLDDANTSSKMEADLYRKRILTYFNQQGPEADKRLQSLDAGLALLWDIRMQYKDRLDRIEKEQSRRTA